MPDKVVIRLINKKTSAKREEPKAKTVLVYHWNRIFGAMLIAVVLVGILTWSIQRAVKGPSGETTGAESSPASKTQAALAAPQDHKGEVARSEGKSHHHEAAANASAPTKPGAAATERKETASSAEGSAASPAVTIVSGNIKRAQLTSGLQNGEPVDSIGPTIPMNERGLVKVYLFMETSGLKGRTLFHDWYWKGKRMAHARVPIKRKDQTVASSKFIDRIMMGSWEVRVVDEKDNLMAKTGFEVQ